MSTSLSPNEAERRVELSYQHYQIPVVERSPDGRVRSGRFDPDAVWGVMADDRIVCGMTEETDDRGRIKPTELEVLVTVHTRTAAGTQLSIESYGRGRTVDEEEVRCRLTREFSMEILASGQASWR